MQSLRESNRYREERALSLASEKAIGKEGSTSAISMKRCASCGKRIWSSGFSSPELGDYHIECARLAGLVPKELEEVYERAKDLTERMARGEDVRNIAQELNELRDLEAQARKKKGI